MLGTDPLQAPPSYWNVNFNGRVGSWYLWFFLWKSRGRRCTWWGGLFLPFLSWPNWFSSHHVRWRCKLNPTWPCKATELWSLFLSLNFRSGWTVHSDVVIIHRPLQAFPLLHIKFANSSLWVIPVVFGPSDQQRLITDRSLFLPQCEPCLFLPTFYPASQNICFQILVLSLMSTTIFLS